MIPPILRKPKLPIALPSKFNPAEQSLLHAFRIIVSPQLLDYDFYY